MMMWRVERFGFWLEKNNEGWGSIIVVRVIFKRGVKLFSSKFLFPVSFFEWLNLSFSMRSEE